MDFNYRREKGNTEHIKRTRKGNTELVYIDYFSD